MDGSDENIFRMDNLFIAIGLMFAGYWTISDYAKSKGVHITNASSKTYIDAFERSTFAAALTNFQPESRQSGEITGSN